LEQGTAVSRATGHAFLAAQARSALGLQAPAPGGPGLLIASGMGVLASAALVAVSAVPVGAAGALTVTLALVIAAASIAGEDRAARTAARGLLLSVAAVAEVGAAVLTPDVRPRLFALVAAGFSMAVAPQLARRGSGAHRQLAREGMGVLLAATLMLVVAPGGTPAQLLAAGLVLGTVTMDALMVEHAGLARTALGAAAVAGATGLLDGLVGAPAGALRAGTLLVAWYGLRGLAQAAAMRRGGRLVVLEYSAFVVAGALALAWTAHR
jgi:hypothetical protein